RGRMMREVLVQSDSCERAAQLEPALDAFELRECLQRDVGCHADVAGRRDRRKRVLEVVLADERPAARAASRALLEDAEARFHSDRVVCAIPARGTFARAE